jgi:hypothetical protein
LVVNTSTYNAAYVLECTNCKNLFRVEGLGFPLAGLPRYCPTCGTQNSIRRSLMDSDKNYWYHLAESFGLPKTSEGAKMIKTIYDAWDTQEHRTFAAFVASLEEATEDDE